MANESNVKGACCAMLVGFVALALSPWAILSNEEHAVCTGKAFDDAEAQVQERGCAYNRHHDGDFVHVSCDVVSSESLTTLKDTHLHTEGFIMTATTEMWQWKESSQTWTETYDDDYWSYTYEEEHTCWCWERTWSQQQEVLTPSRDDSPKYPCPGCHDYPSDVRANPTPARPLGTVVEHASSIQMGESVAGPAQFSLSSEQVNALVNVPRSVSTSWSPDRNVARDFPVYGTAGNGWEVIGANTWELDNADAGGYYGYYYGWYYDDAWDGERTIGDIRLEVKAFGSDYASVVGKQRPGGALTGFPAGGSNFPYCRKKNVFGAELSTQGYTSGRSLFVSLRRKLSSDVALYRFLTWLLVLVAFLLITSPLKAVPEAVPFVGRCLGEVAGAALGVMCLALSVAFWAFFTAICWVAYRPLYGGLMLAGVVICTIGAGVCHTAGRGGVGYRAGYQLQLS